jgi:hypothetical protein
MLIGAFMKKLFFFLNYCFIFLRPMNSPAVFDPEGCSGNDSRGVILGNEQVSDYSLLN